MIGSFMTSTGIPSAGIKMPSAAKSFDYAYPWWNKACFLTPATNEDPNSQPTSFFQPPLEYSLVQVHRRLNTQDAEVELNHHCDEFEGAFSPIANRLPELRNFNFWRGFFVKFSFTRVGQSCSLNHQLN
jgi:hypothetical protein